MSYEIRKSWIKTRRMMVDIISIYIKNSFKIKIEIYLQKIEIITRCKSKYYSLYKVFSLDIKTRKKLAIECLLMIGINKNVLKCHLIIANININYKKKIIIVNISLGIQ